MKRSLNQSAQPMPGDRRGFNLTQVARHGWPHRWPWIVRHVGEVRGREIILGIDLGRLFASAESIAIGVRKWGLSPCVAVFRGGIRMGAFPESDRVWTGDRTSSMKTETANQALEPMETRVSVLDMAALASRVSPGLHGSVRRWP
jgi:hypothetical protein